MNTPIRPITRHLTFASKAFGPGQPVPPTLRVCKSCEFYREHGEFKNSGLGACSLFGRVDLVTGERVFERAIVARSDTRQCGPDGVHYATRAHWEHRHEKDVATE